MTYSDPEVTYIDPKVTYIDPKHLLLPLPLPYLVHNGLNHGDLEKYGGRKVVVVVVATKFSVKHQGKVYHHPPSTIHK